MRGFGNNFILDGDKAEVVAYKRYISAQLLATIARGQENKKQQICGGLQALLKRAEVGNPDGVIAVTLTLLERYKREPYLNKLDKEAVIADANYFFRACLEMLSKTSVKDLFPHSSSG